MAKTTHGGRPRASKAGGLPSPSSGVSASSHSPSHALSAPAVVTSRTRYRRTLSHATQVIRGLSVALEDRMRGGVDDYARTYGGRRDMYRALGYKRTLTLADYRQAYEREDIAQTIVEAYPEATWSNGIDLVEDESPDNVTEFEQAHIDLDERIGLWSKVMRADVAAGLGQYSVILLGVSANSDTDYTQPLTSLSGPDDLLYLTTLTQERARIVSFLNDPSDPYHGQPEFYSLSVGTPVNRAGVAVNNLRNSTKWIKVHYTRLIHIAEGMLTDDIYGRPRLRPVWNRLCDLQKVVGGGSEAAWTRADPGIHIDVDPELELSPEAEDDLEAEIEEYRHGFSRLLQTQGGKVNLLQAAVSMFGSNADTIIKLISAVTRIPHRILVGSERGELSSSQDRDNWKDRVNARRNVFAEPLIRRRVIGRFIELGILPEPTRYDIAWPDPEDLNDKDKAAIALQIAQANQYNTQASAGLILTGDEMRDMYWGQGPAEVPAADATTQTGPDQQDVAESDTTQPKAAGAGAGHKRVILSFEARRRMKLASLHQARREYRGKVKSTAAAIKPPRRLRGVN
jgi:hypothetical protein